MKRWFVTYSEHRLMEVEVEAENEDEAQNIVLEGGADYESAREIDAEVTDVSNVEFSSDSDPEEDE